MEIILQKCYKILCFSLGWKSIDILLNRDPFVTDKAYDFRNVDRIDLIGNSKDPLVQIHILVGLIQVNHGNTIVKDCI